MKAKYFPKKKNQFFELLAIVPLLVTSVYWQKFSKFQPFFQNGRSVGVSLKSVFMEADAACGHLTDKASFSASWMLLS